MAYLDNTTIVLDAVLTKKGRDLLSKGLDKFNITQYSFSDDEIDYSLWNNSHPSGSDSFGNIIENTPILEALTDDAQIMKYRLVSIPNVTNTLTKIYLPYITLDNSSITDGSTTAYETQANYELMIGFSPKTSIYATGGTSNGITGMDTANGYTFLIAKDKDSLLNTNGLFTDLNRQFVSYGNGASNNFSYTDSDSVVRVGQALNIVLNKTLSTFPSTTTIPITVTGNESGAIFQFILSITRGTVA